MRVLAFCTAVIVSLFAAGMSAQAAQHHTKPHPAAHHAASHHAASHHATSHKAAGHRAAGHQKPSHHAKAHERTSRTASHHRGAARTAANRHHGSSRAAHRQTGHTKQAVRHAIRSAHPVVRAARPHVPATIQDARTAGLARWRGVERAERRYHWNDYVHPSGWYEHRWVVGENLPSAWFAQDYWITDWSGFGLMGPPMGFVWVRVGEDAVLVDTETGEVLRVVYGVFY